MRAFAYRRWLVVLALCGGFWASTSGALGAETEKPVFEPAYLANAQQGSAFLPLDGGCYQCHRTNAGAEPQPSRPDSINRVTFRETNVWREKDFHDQSGLALTSPRAKRMAELLHYDVTKNTQCLGCHTGTQKIAEQAGAPPQLTAPEERMVMEHGVSCQACHGPAKNWDGPHRFEENWWKKPSEEKYAAGLLDVRHPKSRAQICLSCHLGSSAEGKIVTHEMYAAGHPPLGNFELESFLSGMPYHGIPIEDKAKSAPEALAPWYRKDGYYRTRSVLTASIVALRMELQLLHDEAAWAVEAQKAAPPAKANDGLYQPRWPELAHFNCSSCHHELANDRRAPDHAGSAPPGRPMLRSWPTALYEAAMRGMGRDPEAKPALADLEREMSRNPFGRVERVRDAAASIAKQLDEDLADFENTPIDRAQALKYLQAICDVGLEPTPGAKTESRARPIDFEEARQLALAATTIVRELRDPKAGATDAEIAALKAVEPAVDAFDKELALGFAKKPPKPDPVADFHKVVYSPALLALGTRVLNASVEFDDEMFRAHLRMLKISLPAKK